MGEDCKVNEKKEAAEKAGYFKTLGVPSLVYALIYTVCMFQNSSGITMPFWVASAVLYACIVMKNLGVLHQPKDGGKEAVRVQLKRGSGIYILIMLLLGVSTCFTDNVFIIFCNYIGFFMVLPAFLLHNFFDDSRWDFGKSLAEIAAAVAGAIGCMLTPFSDASACYKEKKVQKNQTFRAVLAGLACSVPGVVVLGAFLADADAVFASMVTQMFSGFRIPMNIARMLLMLLFGFFSAYCGMRFLSLHSKKEGKDEQGEQRKFGPVTAMAFTAVIAVMYLVFCGIQVVYLFAGHMQLPKGMTYAAYARSGFFQLLFVCMVNFVMVLVIHKYFAHHRGLNLLLLLICACTFVMTASSAYRMLLYIGTYHLTFLRVLVLAALAALALLMAGAVLMLIHPGFPLFRYSMIVVSVVYLGFSFSHADYYIASYNLAQAKSDDRNMDWWYLGTLSMDAAPAIADYYEKAPKEMQIRMDAYAQHAKNLSENKDGYYLDEQEPEIPLAWYTVYMQKMYAAGRNMRLRSFNISRYLAVKMLERV